LRNALTDALHQLSGTYCRKLFSAVTLLQFLSLGERHSSFPRLSLLPLLINTLPGPRASEVTTLWRYTNVFIIIIKLLLGSRGGIVEGGIVVVVVVVVVGVVVFVSGLSPNNTALTDWFELWLCVQHDIKQVIS